MEKEQRKAQRIAVELPMQLETKNGEVFIISTWDFSASGVFLTVEEHIKQKLTVNDTVMLQFQGTNFTPPVMKASVVRINESGIGLQLVEELKPGDASSQSN